MPNPNGNNQFDHFEREAVYGASKRMMELQKESPMSGAPMVAGAMNAPKRSQRRAARGAKTPAAAAALPQASPQEPAGGVMPTQGPPPTPGAQLASIWGEIAAIPGMPATVHALAERAQQQWGYAGE